MATAIPRSTKRQATVGNTFLLLHLRSELVLVDSHKHQVGGGQKMSGTIIARAKPETMIEWIFKTEGFLEEMNCCRDFVAVTTFWISERSLAAWAREQRGSQPRPAGFHQQRGSQPRPAASSSAAAVSPASQPKPQVSTPSVQPAAPKQGSSSPAVQAASCGSAASPAAAAVSPASQPKPRVSTPAVPPEAPKQGSSAPAAQAASSGSQPMPQASTARIASMQIAGSDEHTHTSFVRGCARCAWEKNGRSWQKVVAFKDPKSGQMVTPIIPKPAHLGGAWAIGCCVCALSFAIGP